VAPRTRFLRRLQKLAKSQAVRSSGIKPLNAPRVIHVRTNSGGNPTSIQVPPTISSRRKRGTAQRNNPHPNPLPTRERGQDQHAARTGPPSLQGRELEGGSKRSVDATKAQAPPLVSDRKWLTVVEIENLWKVNDEWWRGPEDEIARLYYVLRLANGQQLTVYLDLTTNNWYRQAG
jgi:hypothetical protein